MDHVDQGLGGPSAEVIVQHGLILAIDDCADWCYDLFRKEGATANAGLYGVHWLNGWCFDGMQRE